MEKRIVGVPFFRQLGPNCLPACICSIMNYYGIKILPGVIAWEMLKEKPDRIMGIDLTLALYQISKKWELSVAPFISHFDDLIKDMLNKNIPLVVIQKLKSDSKTLHSRVLIGYSEGNGVYLLDPNVGEIELSMDEFNQGSSEPNFSLQNIFVIISPEYRKEYDGFLNSNPFYLNITGVLKEMEGDEISAEYYYKKCIAIAPQYADPYNNLALLYHKKSDLNNAKKFADIAIKLEPREFAYQETRRLCYESR